MIALLYMIFIGCSVMAGVAGSRGAHAGMIAYSVAAFFAMLTIALEQSDIPTPQTAGAAAAAVAGTES